MKSVAIDRPFSHHGQHSGYGMLGKLVSDKTTAVPTYGHWVSRVVPDRWLYRVSPFHPRWYDRFAFGLETEVALALGFCRKAIYHFLYGEHSLRFSGMINRATGRRNRIVATYHQLPQFFELRRRQYSHVRDLDAVILVASNQRSFFDSIVSPHQVHVIPHGIDSRFFEPSKDQKKGHQVRCLTVGSNYRDFSVHARVIRDINRSMLAGEIEFVVVGESRCRDHFLGLDHFKYLSGVSDQDLLAFYQSSDILLLPLSDSTACNALLEGMACGLSIIATDVGGVRDYVNEKCAILTPPGDAGAMVDAVAELVRDPERRAQLGSAARDRARVEFDWTRIADRMRGVYRDLW